MSFGRLGSLGRGFGRLGWWGRAGSGVIPGSIAAGGGSYVWTGQDASLAISAARSVAAGAGSYAWTGDTMTPLQDHFVTASGGSYAWTGQDATLTKSGGSLGLQTDLTGFWELEDTGWTDATGNGTTLTASGSPTTASGKVGNAASFSGSNYLTATSNANILNGGGSFSVQAWVNISTTPASSTIIFNKDNNAFGQREWGLGSKFTSSNVWCFQCYNTSTGDEICNSTVTISSGWHHLVGTFNATGGVQKIYVDGTDATSGTPTVSGTMQSTASAPLNIGRTVGTAIGASLVDQCGFWKGRVLSASDVTALYNGGAGLSYAAMA